MVKMYELCAMVRQLGSPTFFMTFSPAEKDWYELIVLIYILATSIFIIKMKVKSKKIYYTLERDLI